MSIKIIEKTNEKIVLSVKKVETPVLNALRRALMSDVPVMAIEDVYFTKNNSALYDEMVALRLGLVPLTTDLSYSKRKDCTCKGEGCSKCQVTLTLSKTGPCTVYSGDMVSSDPKVKPAITNIPIDKLIEGQELEFEAKAELGTAKDHAKWSAGLAYYKFKPELKIDSKKVTPESKKLAENSPNGILTYKAGKLEADDKKLWETDDAVIEEYLAKNANGEVKLFLDDSEVIFVFENWGQLSHKQAMESALDLITEELSILKKELTK